MVVKAGDAGGGRRRIGAVEITRLAAVALASAVVFALPAGAAEPARGQRTITVGGTGSVRVAPASAEWSFGVVTQAATAGGTLEANSRQMARVIAALKAAGIVSADLRTEYVSLSPRTSPDGSSIVGYSASNTVRATVRDVARLGSIVDAAVGAGADQVFGPALLAPKEDALRRAALAAAFDDAQAKAKALAAKAGGTLGRALSIAEGGGPVPLPVGAATERAQVPIEPGLTEIQASVTVVFAIS